MKIHETGAKSPKSALIDVIFLQAAAATAVASRSAGLTMATGGCDLGIRPGLHRQAMSMMLKIHQISRGTLKIATKRKLGWI